MSLTVQKIIIKRKKNDVGSIIKSNQPSCHIKNSGTNWAERRFLMDEQSDGSHDLSAWSYSIFARDKCSLFSCVIIARCLEIMRIFPSHNLKLLKLGFCGIKQPGIC